MGPRRRPRPRRPRRRPRRPRPRRRRPRRPPSPRRRSQPRSEKISPSKSNHFPTPPLPSHGDLKEYKDLYLSHVKYATSKSKKVCLKYIVCREYKPENKFKIQIK